MATLTVANCQIVCTIEGLGGFTAPVHPFEVPESLTLHVAAGSSAEKELSHWLDSLDPPRKHFSRNAREGRYGGRIKGQHVRGWLGQSLIENRRKS
jgi:hypothetical protein